MKRLLIGVGFVLCLGRFAKADPSAALRTGLAEQVDAIIGESLAKRVQFSIHIVQAPSGKTLYDHDARELMIPASNMKIITSAAALKYLGPDYEFKTRVGLLGNALVVIGSGDPLLGDEKTDARYGRGPGWIFKDIANALKAKGIGTIEDIIVDSSVFDNEPVHPNWPANDLNKWYACEVSGLNFNDNCVRISVKNTDGKIAIFLDPPTSFIALINKVEAISKGSGAVGTYRNRQPNHLTVFGKCRDAVGPFDVAIERPAAFFGYLLFEHLAKADIVVKGQLVEKAMDDYGGFRPLVQYSTPLADCLARCNKNSLGLVAESLLKKIAAQSNPDGKNGSWEKGRELVSMYLAQLGLDKSQYYIDDGSGLSRQNELTAYTVTTVFLDIHRGPNWPLYRDSLAVGGQDGTIEQYFKQEQYRDRIRGKTGYVSGVRSFSGVCSTAEGDVVFSILCNNTNGETRTVINGIAKAIIDDADSRNVIENQD
ncbi:MAG TPA: D-alanyl-D-alanine carboxypeptidase/D-alanyl-D-alanine-endopeptidase [Sedimentisphaerales bacterium]|nr:D-alanyl-D-alanine carboxypeptidase/D-alanyl-D-alanine-endopeptidase [Sedimentisphaerales bacterium]